MKKNIKDSLQIDAELFQSRLDLEDFVKDSLTMFPSNKIVIEGKEEHLSNLGLSKETTIWTVKCVYKK